MLTRRIAVGVCALCLAIPAAAGASPGAKPAEAKGPYGLNPPGPRITVKAKGPYGIALPGPRGFYKGITNKFANVISFEDPSDFDAAVSKATATSSRLKRWVTIGSRSTRPERTSSRLRSY